MGDGDDYLLMIDQIKPMSDISFRTPRWNYTQYHWVEPDVKVNNTLCDNLTVDDELYLITRYGDIKIS